MRKSLTVAIAIIITSSALIESEAKCEHPRIISSIFPPGSYSYVVTPGVQVGLSGSSVTSDLKGSFWALGGGDPDLTVGHDNGVFEALAGKPYDWVQRPLGYPATFHTSWATGGELVDGCIDETESETKCTVVLLTDQHAGRGHFALLTAAATHGNHSFAQPQNGAITLAPIPTLTIDAINESDRQLDISLSLDIPKSGLYLDDKCPANLVAGFKVYGQVVDLNASTPIDRTRERETSSKRWELISGTSETTGHPYWVGETANVRIDCDQNKEWYLASSIVFDGGFETRHVSANVGPIRCGE